MPLQQLVEYFNDRLEQEHNNRLRPFLLQSGSVIGLFGSIRIGTRLSPIRETLRDSHVTGYTAQLCVGSNPLSPAQRSDIEHLVSASPEPLEDKASIINFDRLSRTVHMLNYLPQTHLDELLFLEVDPRHILGVKEDHGAYFEEVIIKCGLKTDRVVIGLKIGRDYTHFYPLLLKGLQNYQKRGYRLNLGLEYPADDKAVNDFISRVAPDFVGLSAPDLDQVRDNRKLDNLQKIERLVNSLNGRTVLFDIEDKRNAVLARQAGFALVQGRYFEQLTQQQNEFASLPSAARTTDRTLRSVFL
jgi:EAL domain-containing protein (putative c-di-GMP-specific phosphodiesterase class I)